MLFYAISWYVTESFAAPGKRTTELRAPKFVTMLGFITPQTQSRYMPRSASLPSLDEVVFFDMETQGRDPFKHKITTIQVRHNGKTSIWKEWELGEEGCINSFFDFLEKVTRKELSFVGYNQLKFDVSFLDVRLRQLKLMDERKWNILHNWLHWIDLYQFLGDAYYGARVWYSSLAGTEQKIENADIPELYNQGEHEKITGYVEDEMKGMELVYQGMMKEPFYKELVRLRAKVVRQEATPSE